MWRILPVGVEYTHGISIAEREGEADMTERKRPWFLTIWISLLLIYSFFNALTQTTVAVAMRYGFWDIPEIAFPIPLVLSWVSLVCVIALFHWKKWGFLGFLGSSIVLAVFSFTDKSLVPSALNGLSGALILFFLLHTGKENKAWLKFD